MGYKTGDGVEPDLLAQFQLAEDMAAALGLTVWPMVEFEADDAIAAAAVRFADCEAVDQVLMCSPDKDLAQMVSGQRVVALDRRKGAVMDEAGVIEKFGVPPSRDPRLPCPGRRRRRRHPRHPPLGRAYHGNRADPVRQHR